MTYYPLLSVRTDFSLGESTIGVSDLDEISEISQTDVVGVVDTMSVSSLVEATKTLSKSGKRVLTGVRVRVIMQPGKEETAAYLKLYPINEAGIQSIYRVLTRAFTDDRFYYVPRVTWSDLDELLADDCVAISTGDADSVMQREDMRDALSDLCAKVRFAARFYELVASDTPYYSRQNKIAIEWGLLNSAFGGNHVWEPLVVMPTMWMGDDSHTYSISASIIEKRPYEDYLRPAPEYRPHSAAEMANVMVAASAAVNGRYSVNYGKQFVDGMKNQARLVEVCAYKWTKQEPSLPIVAADPDKALTDLCKAGWSERFKTQVFAHQPDAATLAKEYLPRLQFELETLKRLGFAQYFLIVADLVRWAKKEGIYVGPGRGSVGGSLVAYLTGITDVDPIRFALLFERFINPDRLDLPDADLDFMSTRRGEVVKYLEAKWGAENVAGIVNYNTLGARSAIKDVGRILNLTPADMNATKFIGDNHGVSESLEQAHAISFEIQEFARQHPKVWGHATKLEGKMRSYGTHAAGVVVAGIPLTDRAVVEQRTSPGSGRTRVINWDKRVSEEQGLIKLDVLGLSTLDMFDQAIKQIWKRHTKRIDINAIALDDPKAIAIFNEARTQGIFQFEGGSVRRLLKDMAKAKPVDFEDLVALNALNRPGPLDAGLAESYIKRRAGQEAVTYPHPVLEPVLKPTFGVITYQEQVMQVSRVLSGFTPGEADTLRKIMGKKLPAEMAKQRDKFVDGAVNTSGMDRQAADNLFTMIEGFAGYAFNRSHAVEYTLISFQAAWLKAHYTVEFYCAQMGTTSDDKLSILVKKAAQEGIRVIPPDVNVSTGDFEPLNDNIIIAPLTAVSHISENGARAIVAARTSAQPVITDKTTGRGSKKVTVSTSWGPGRFVSLDDFRARVAGKAVNARAIDHLQRVGAFAQVIAGELPSTHPKRQKDQIELMPALADQGVVADRDIPLDDTVADFIIDNEAQLTDELGPGAVHAHLGRDPKMMVILDAPFNDYQKLPEQFSYQEYVAPSLKEAGLSIDDAIWSWVIRRPLKKGEREAPEEETAASIKYLQKEIAIMRPPVIVLLGGTAVKSFFPDMKRPNDNIGHKAFSSNLDATVIVGFKPTQIYFDATKAEKLTEIFSAAAELIKDPA